VQRVFLFYCLSGFVSLGYQVVWFRIFVDRFGSTNLTFLLVLTSFIGGLGLGAIWSRAATQRLAASGRLKDPLRVYGLAELLVAGTALLTVLAGLIPADLWGSFPYQSQDGIYSRTFPYEFGQLVIGVLCVGVPCFFMGVTFPLLGHAYREEHRFPSALYAWNTLGASAGVLATQFLLIPWLGHGQTYWIMLVLNLFIAFFFLRGGGAYAREARPDVRGASSRAAVPAEQATRLGVLLALGTLSGFLAGALEGDLFKRIWLLGGTSSAAMSFISFWAILAIFLGSWTVRTLPALRLLHIKVAYTLALLYYALAGAFAYPIRGWFEVEDPEAAPFDAASAMLAIQSDLGQTLLFVGVFVFPALYLVSLLLPYVCNAAQGDQRRLGLVYGANTLAFCLGLVGFVWLAPRVNVFYSMKLMMALTVIGVVFLWTVAEGRRLGLWRAAGAMAAALTAAVLTPAGFDRSYVDPARRAYHLPVRAMKSNGTHTTFVVSAPEGDYLYFDFHPMSGTGLSGQIYMRLMAHFPLLAQEAPRRALLVGFGVGNTAGAIAAHEDIERIDVVELNHKVIETAPEFAATNGHVYRDPRVRFIHDDGRSYLAVTRQRYDLITAEPPPPTQDGVHRLYSREYYQQVLAHLTPEGRFTQWLPILQLSSEAVERIVATFLEVFPHATLFSGYGRELILMGGSVPVDLSVVERRLQAAPTVASDLKRLGVDTPLGLFARLLKGDAGLRRDYGGLHVISDQRNDLAPRFKGPGRPVRIAYDPREMLADVGAERLDVYAQLHHVVTHLGRLHYRVPDMPLGSLEVVRGADAAVLGDADWRRIESLHTLYANALRAGRDETALERLREALAQAEVQPRLWLEMARLQMTEGRYAQTVDALRRFLAIEPQEAAGYVAMATALAGLERHVEALDMAERAVALAPDDPRAYKVRADALAGIGRNLEALKDYGQALRLDPDYTGALASETALIEKLREPVAY